jgi:hypothetical protein
VPGYFLLARALQEWVWRVVVRAAMTASLLTCLWAERRCYYWRLRMSCRYLRIERCGQRRSSSLGGVVMEEEVGLLLLVLLVRGWTAISGSAVDRWVAQCSMVEGAKQLSQSLVIFADYDYIRLRSCQWDRWV